MKKQIASLSAAAAVVIGFSGFFGIGGDDEGTFTTPVKQRAQSIDAEVMITVKDEAPHEFKKSLAQSKYRQVTTKTLNDLQHSDSRLYDLIFPIAQEAQRMYKERKLPQDITENGPDWLMDDLEALNVTTATTGKKFNGRYSPYNDLLILNYDKNTDEMLAKFLIAHEFAHAIALHISEEKTTQQKALDGAEETSNIVQDILLNETYVELQSSVKETIDHQAKSSFDQFFNAEDLKNEQKILVTRKNGFFAQAVIMAGEQDQLYKLGIDLEIPLKTKMTLRYLVQSGVDVTDAFDVLKGGVDFASANVIAISGHPKEQELEADSIALELTKGLTIDTLPTACRRFAGNKETGMFDSHPSYIDRRENLGCAN